MKNPFKENILEFQMVESHMPPLEPAKKSIPDWYRDSTRFITDSSGNYVNPEYKNGIMRSLKLCVPFLDSLTAGYYIPLVKDILVEQTDQGPQITWKDSFEILKSRLNSITPTLPTPVGFSSQHFAWSLPCCFKVAKGYSMLVTHPLNRYDLPFYTLSGVIDGGFAVYGGSVPVFFNKKFEGVIPKGTPIAQIIPFKQDKWRLKQSETLKAEADESYTQSSSRLSGWYKRTVWEKKQYL